MYRCVILVQVRYPGARLKICSSNSTVSNELAFEVIPKLSNSMFGLQFDALNSIQSSPCCWFGKIDTLSFSVLSSPSENLLYHLKTRTRKREFPREISHWPFAFIFRHTLLSAWKKNTFVYNFYTKNTATVTKKTWFRIGIINTFIFPRLHSFPSLPHLWDDFFARSLAM